MIAEVEAVVGSASARFHPRAECLQSGSRLDSACRSTYLRGRVALLRKPLCKRLRDELPVVLVLRQRRQTKGLAGETPRFLTAVSLTQCRLDKPGNHRGETGAALRAQLLHRPDQFPVGTECQFGHGMAQMLFQQAQVVPVRPPDAQSCGSQLSRYVPKGVEG